MKMEFFPPCLSVTQEQNLDKTKGRRQNLKWQHRTFDSDLMVLETRDHTKQLKISLQGKVPTLIIYIEKQMNLKEYYKIYLK